MRIKMITLYAGPAGVMQAGEIHDVESAVAKALVDGRYAVAVQAATVVETADLVIDEPIEVRVQPEAEPIQLTKRSGKSKG